MGAIVIAQGAPLDPTCSAFALATSLVSGKRVEVHVIGEKRTFSFGEQGEPKRCQVNLTDVNEDEDTVEAEMVELTPKPPAKHCGASVLGLADGAVIGLFERFDCRRRPTVAGVHPGP